MLIEVCDSTGADVDIVFIHGLMGDAEKTWTNDDVFWPRDLLPKDVPKARVLSFGYDSQVVHFWSEPSQNRIDNHADTLLADLVGIRHRTATNERPIIFVCHSLGGIVCEQALLKTRSGSPSNKSLGGFVRSIAFLGTPHLGSDKASWAEMCRCFVSCFGISTNTELVKNLDSKSEVLTRIGRDFPEFLDDRIRNKKEIEVVCFFEAKKFKGAFRKTKIVEEQSACLQGKTRLSLYADHSEMCKYEDEQDQNYRQVVDVLARWARTVNDQPSDDHEARTVNNVKADFSSSTNHALQTAMLNGNVDFSGAVHNYNKP